MRVNSSRPVVVHLGQRADDLMDVAARAEIAAGAGDHDGFDLRRVVELAERVAKLGIAVEGQRVLALGPVERDRRDAVIELPQEMGRLEGRGVEAHALVPPSMVTAAPLMSRLCGRHRVRIMVPIAIGIDQPPARIHVGDRAARIAPRCGR